MMYFFVAELKHGPIQVDSFAAYVKFMHTDGDYRFNKEFEVKSMIFMFFFYIVTSHGLVTSFSQV